MILKGFDLVRPCELSNATLTIPGPIGEQAAKSTARIARSQFKVKWFKKVIYMTEQ
jgi:hypothetical protein